MSGYDQQEPSVRCSMTVIREPPCWQGHGAAGQGPARYACSPGVTESRLQPWALSMYELDFGEWHFPCTSVTAIINITVFYINGLIL